VFSGEIRRFLFVFGFCRQLNMTSLRDYFSEIYFSASFVAAGLLTNKYQKYPLLARKFWFTVSQWLQFRLDGTIEKLIGVPYVENGVIGPPRRLNSFS